MKEARIVVVAVGCVASLISGCSTTAEKDSTMIATFSDPSDVTPMTPTPSETWTSAPMPTPTTLLPSVTKDVVFGPGAVDLLNDFDLGSRSDQIAICGDVLGVISEMSAAGLESSIDSMNDYEYSALTDLVADCSALS